MIELFEGKNFTGKRREVNFDNSRHGDVLTASIHSTHSSGGGLSHQGIGYLSMRVHPHPTAGGHAVVALLPSVASPDGSQGMLCSTDFKGKPLEVPDLTKMPGGWNMDDQGFSTIQVDYFNYVDVKNNEFNLKQAEESIKAEVKKAGGKFKGLVVKPGGAKEDDYMSILAVVTVEKFWTTFNLTISIKFTYPSETKVAEPDVRVEGSGIVGTVVAAFARSSITASVKKKIKDALAPVAGIGIMPRIALISPRPSGWRYVSYAIAGEAATMRIVPVTYMQP